MRATYHIETKTTKEERRNTKVMFIKTKSEIIMT